MHDRSVWMVVFVAASFGCGGGGGAASDGHAGPDGGGDTIDSGSDDGSAVHSGQVLVLEEAFTGNMLTLSNVGFASIEETVVSRDNGPCHVSDETTGGILPTSAGTLTISGGSGSASVFVPDGDDTYQAIMTSGFAYTGGDTLQISATGSDVPAFTSTLAFPSAVSKTGAASLTTLSKTADLTLAWTGSAASVHVLVEQNPSQTETLAIDCTFAGSDGSGTIPAAAFADLAVGVAASVTLASETVSTVTAGDYTILGEAVIFEFTAGPKVTP